MNGRGVLGTNASLLSDLSLLTGVGVAVLLTIGVALAIRKKFYPHRIVQSSAVSLNVLQVALVMVGSFTRSAAPGIPNRLNETYYTIALGHGLLGLSTLVLGVFIAVRANELLPPFLHFLRFHNFKLFMRTAYVLYMLSTALGVGVYVIWYTGTPAEAPVPSTQENTESTVTVPMRNFAFAPADVVVPLGTNIVWLNQDAAPHTATADNGHSFKSDLLHSGEAFNFVATELGEFRYYCELHGSSGGVGMSGTIKVVAPGTEASAPHVAAPQPLPTPTSVAKA